MYYQHVKLIIFTGNATVNTTYLIYYHYVMTAINTGSDKSSIANSTLLS